ncbi:MAG: serine/threonine protein kinase [Candidatus Obscuribacter sp.]|nr:serine/threonine protein kinase [Candidatus Obscuribacter sp.]
MACLYLVMDFLEGTNLSKIVEAGTALPVGTAVDVFIQSCSALSHAHKGLSTEGMAKITGAVDGEGEDLTKSGEVFGSPLYMSPEQCMGKVLDARSDIYSLGCVIYRTLTGCTAVSGTSAIECFSHHVNSLPRPFAEACPGAEFPEGLEAIVMKSVAKDPDDRYQTMDELKDSLLALAGIDFSSMYSSLGGANISQHDTVLQSSYGSSSHYSQKLCDGC